MFSAVWRSRNHGPGPTIKSRRGDGSIAPGAWRGLPRARGWAHIKPMAEPIPGAHQLFLREEQLREGLALLDLAARALARAGGEGLAREGLGPTQARILFFAGRVREATVGDLLILLDVSKQNLNRALKPMIERGLVTLAPAARDRRRRVLTLTTAGRALEAAVIEPERARLAGAYRGAGAQAVEGFRRVLASLIGPRATAVAGRVE